MNIPEVNNILKMYNIQVRRDAGQWYVASVHSTEHDTLLWGHIDADEFSAEDLCEYVLKNVDAIRRFNGE
jgi:hypothetical protein